MVPRHPQPPQHQHHKRPPTLPRCRRQSPNELIRLGDAETKAIEQTLFDQRQQKEKPYTESDIEIGKIHKANDREVEADVNRRKTVRDLDGMVPLDLGKKVKEKTDHIPQDNAKRNSRPRPEDFAVHDRWQAAGTIIVGDEGLRHFHQRIGQPLALDPLLAQDDHHAEADQIQSPEKAQPPKQRHGPSGEQGAPRSRFANGQPLEKPSHGQAVVGRQ